MKKGNLVALVLGTFGGMLASVGFVVALVEEFNAFIPGVVIGVIGLILLLLIFPIYRRVEKLAPIKLKKEVVIPSVVGVLAAIILGIGMCMCLIGSSSLMIPGIIIGMIGIVICIFNYPIFIIIKNKPSVS